MVYINIKCKRFNIYVSIHNGTFFEETTIDIRIIAKWCFGSSISNISNIVNALNRSEKTLNAIENYIAEKILETDFKNNKLVCANRIV